LLRKGKFWVLNNIVAVAANEAVAVPETDEGTGASTPPWGKEIVNWGYNKSADYFSKDA
jgi:hypothetical protein